MPNSWIYIRVRTECEDILTSRLCKVEVSGERNEFYHRMNVLFVDAER